MAITLACQSDLHSELGVPSSGTMLCGAKELHSCLLHLPQMIQERFAAQRPVGAPPISVVRSIKESAAWGSLQVDIPFEPANDIIGRTLSCEALVSLPKSLDRTWFSS